MSTPIPGKKKKNSEGIDGCVEWILPSLFPFTCAHFSYPALFTLLLLLLRSRFPFPFALLDAFDRVTNPTDGVVGGAAT